LRLDAVPFCQNFRHILSLRRLTVVNGRQMAEEALPHRPFTDGRCRVALERVFLPTFAREAAAELGRWLLPCRDGLVGALLDR
jgi:hypothetical protein